MTAYVKHLVLHVIRRVAIELGDLVGKTLPLGLVMVGVVGGVVSVGVVDETEV